MKRSRIARNWVVCLIILSLSAFPILAYAQAEGEVIAEGFNGPMGVLVGPDGNESVIDSGLGGATEIETVNPETRQTTTAMVGDTARVVMIAPDGAQTEIATLPSYAIGEAATGGARLALADGVLYATTGDWLQDAMEEP